MSLTDEQIANEGRAKENAWRQHRAAVTEVTKLLKKKFNNLSVDEVMQLAFDVVEAVEKEIR